MKMKVDFTSSLVILLLFAACQVDSCTFPQQWQGSWYQREGEVDISRTHVTTKGTCFEKEGDKYIVKRANSDGDPCYSCLAVIKRHENVLQYKESHCVEDSRRACASIRGDAQLYTLIRESSPRMIPCPFEGPFSFGYDNGSVFCEDPNSSITTCANPAHLKFHFKECGFGSETQNLQLTCLARWNNGGEYVFARFTGPAYTTKNLQYRCMTYDRLKNTLAVSADSTCFGVSEFNTAPIQITLKKEFPDPAATPTCSFPSWLTSTTWRDLTGHTIFQPVGEKSIHVKQGPGRHGHIHESTLRCQRVVEQDASSYKMVSYTTHGCSSKYQCILVSKMAPDGSVLEIQRGKYVTHRSDACREENLSNSTTQTIIANSSNVIQCPLRGYYSLESSTSCDDVITTRCDDKGQIVIDSCNVEVGSLQCIASWTNGDKTHIVATSPSVNRANCFTISSAGDKYRLDLDSNCNNGVSPILRSAYPSYTLQKITGTCLVKENKGESTSSSLSSSSANTGSRDNKFVETRSAASSPQYPTRYARLIVLMVMCWAFL